MMTRMVTALGLAVLILSLVAPVAYAQRHFMETFDDNSAGWTLGTDWEIGVSAPSGFGGGNCNGDPNGDATATPGGGVAGTVLGGNMATNASAGDVFALTSPEINVGTRSDLSLEFSRWLNTDNAAYMDNRVEVWNGSCWVRVATYGTPFQQPADSNWQHIAIDVSAHANPNFRVRFSTEIVQDGFYDDCSGWNIDNVRLQGNGGFRENFDAPVIGWLSSGDFEFGQAVGTTPFTHFGIGEDPGYDSNGVAGGGVAGVVLGGNAAGVVTSKKFLRSPKFDSTGMTWPTLSFDRWLSSDYLPYMECKVEVWNGSAWIALFDYGSTTSNVVDTSWVNSIADLTPYSNSDLQVQFTYEIFSNSAIDHAGWNIDNVCIHDSFSSIGQPAQALAALDVNASAENTNGEGVVTGNFGPFYKCVSVDGPLTIGVRGVPNQPWVLLAGDLNPGANLIPPYGQIDLGGPNLSGLTVVGSGYEPGLFNSFFQTGSGGVGGVIFFVPTSFAGVTLGFQAIMADPSVVIRASNAVRVYCRP